MIKTQQRLPTFKFGHVFLQLILLQLMLAPEQALNILKVIIMQFSVQCVIPIGCFNQWMKQQMNKQETLSQKYFLMVG